MLLEMEIYSSFVGEQSSAILPWLYSYALRVKTTRDRPVTGTA
jgi:hypothetical protein